MRKNIEESQVTVLLEIEGEIHLIAMTSERRDAISALVKASAESCVPTGKNQSELNEFLGYKC